MKKSTLKTEWDLTLLYKSISDPQIDADVQAIEKACAEFAKKYSKKTDYIKSKPALLKILKEYEKVATIVGSSKPYVYFTLICDTDSSNAVAQSKRTLVLNSITASMNNLVFLQIQLAKIDSTTKKSILQDKQFASYKYFLENIWSKAKYQLSEDVEKVLALKSIPAHEQWVNSQSKLLSSQTVVFKNKVIPIHEAVPMVPNLPKKDRLILHKKISEKLKSISHFAEAEMNAIVTDKKITDDLRGLTKPYTATILDYENDEKTIEGLVKAVTENFHISKRFYKLKAKYFGYKNLDFTDIASHFGTLKQSFTFEQAVEIIRRSFAKADPYYVKVFDSFLAHGQIDVYSRKGKRGGGYCWGTKNSPTYVFLNWTNSLTAVTTLGHEMGHATHAEFFKTQPILYRGQTISVAEVASTLFENFVFDEIFSELKENEKVIALFEKIQGSVSTIFRQIALFNFETELHNTIREKGSISKEEIARLMNKHMSSYIGPICNLIEDDGYLFVRWSHIRSFFYVYSYAYGEMISTALYARYKKDHTYIEKINQFMKAGESDTPESIFKAIGIDTTKPEFFVDALKSIEQDIIELEKLVEKKKK